MLATLAALAVFVLSPGDGDSLAIRGASMSADELLDALLAAGPEAVSSLAATLAEPEPAAATSKPGSAPAAKPARDVASKPASESASRPASAPASKPASESPGARRHALASALDAIPAAAKRRLESPTTKDRAAIAAVALRVLRLRGRPSELSAAVALSQADPAVDLSSETEAALTAMLHRDAAAYREVGRAIHGASPRAAMPVVRAVAATASPAAVAALAELVGRIPALDPMILAELGRVALALPHLPSDVAEFGHVRVLLASPDPTARREAALCLGRLRDESAVGGLLPLLEDADTAVRDAARFALRETTTLDLGPDARRWRAWHEAETAWLEERAPKLLEAVERGSIGQATEALADISTHRCGRHELAARLASCLDPKDSARARLICVALAALGSRAGAPALVDLLDAPDRRLRDDAQRALVAITGEDHPAERASWADAVR
ncbi:MAG TPA: HEAT repeat domain-containing protein [Planctomycetota bacterium]|nr:HEAT repeat domain-containing protein [Planctomycetota bacterium]